MKKSSIATTLWLIVMTAIPAWAQGNAPAPPKAEEKKAGWISNGSELGPLWWIFPSKIYTPRPQALLYHLEASYGFSELKGNVEGTYHDLKCGLTLRKNIFTLRSVAIYKKEETQIKTYNYISETEKKFFRESFAVDINKSLAVEAGYTSFYDSNKLYDTSYFYYGGLSAFFPFWAEKVYFKLGAYYGYGRIEYLNDVIEPLGLEIPSYESDGYYLTESLTWQISDRITFTQYADFQQSFDDHGPVTYYGYPLSDTDPPERWKFNLNLTVKLTTVFSVYCAYNLQHDSNPLASIESTNYEKQDSSISLGFKISL